MKVTVLGYYGGYPYKGKGTSGYLIQDNGYNLLLDCGSGVLNSLQNYLDPLQLDAVLITHYHYDHIADLGVLQYYWQLNSGKKKEAILPIYGHTQDGLNFGVLTLTGVTQGYGYSDLQPLNIGPFKITFQRTIHPVPAFATRIEDQAGKVLTFTADTAYFDQLADFAKNSDLIIADTNFGRDKQGTIWHMTSEQSGTLAKKANAKKLLISHLPQEYPLDKLLQETKVAADSIPVKEAAEGLEINL